MIFNDKQSSIIVRCNWRLCFCFYAHGFVNWSTALF